jgi:general secretion pathway protein F
VTTGSPVALIATVVTVGLGFCGAGLWWAASSIRFAAFGWIVFIFGYVMITAATTGGLALPTLPILIGAIVFLNLRRHANNQDALLWVLEVAAERGIPLAPGVRSLAGQVSGMDRLWTAALARFLDEGVSLPEALESIPKLVTRRAAFMIRIGWDSGNLAAGLREAGATRETRQPVLQAIGGRIAYLSCVTAIGSTIVAFVLYFILPKMEAIYHDFGLKLPELTLLVVKVSHVLIDYFYVGAIPFLFVLGYGFVRLLRPGDMTIPIVDRLFARRHTIVILRALAVVIAANRPIPSALDALTEWYPARWVRKRLRQAGLDASHGVEWITALRENSLISESDVGVMASAQRAGNLGWALRELAETGERRWAYRLQAWSQLGFVLAMLVLGLVVLVIGIAFFYPLVTLIERLGS